MMEGTENVEFETKITESQWQKRQMMDLGTKNCWIWSKSILINYDVFWANMRNFCQNMMDFSQDVPLFFMMIRDRKSTLSLYTLSVGQVIVGVMSFHKIYWFDMLKVVQLVHVLVSVLVLVLVEKFEKVWKSLKKCGKVWKGVEKLENVWKIV